MCTLFPFLQLYRQRASPRRLQISLQTSHQRKSRCRSKASKAGTVRRTRVERRMNYSAQVSVCFAAHHLHTALPPLPDWLRRRQRGSAPEPAPEHWVSTAAPRSEPPPFARARSSSGSGCTIAHVATQCVQVQAALDSKFDPPRYGHTTTPYQFFAAASKAESRIRAVRIWQEAQKLKRRY